MTPDPGSMFGSLLKACISDRYLDREKRAGAEGFLFLVLGMVSSVATTYVLSLAGVFV